MSKKFLAMMLGLMLILSLGFMPTAFADPTDVAYYSATFDGLRTTDLKFASASSNYDNTVKLGGTNGGGVFPTRASAGSGTNGTNGPVAYDLNGGINGSGAIVLTAYGNDGTTTSLKTNSIAIPDGGVLELSYDFCALLPSAKYMEYYITNNRTYGKIQLGMTGTSKEFINIAFDGTAWNFVNANGSNKVAVPLTTVDTSGAADASGSYFPDTSWVLVGTGDNTAQKTGWLRLVVRQLSNGTRMGEVIDLKTGNVLFSETVANYSTATSCNFEFCRITRFMDAGSESQTHYKKATVAFDNPTLRAYTVDAPNLVSSSITNGAQDVSLATTEVIVSFDQPITATGATLNGTACTTTFISEENTYKITLPALQAETEYTLALTGFSNGIQTCTDIITFKTEDAGVAVDNETFNVDTDPTVSGGAYTSDANVLTKPSNGPQTQMVSGYGTNSQALNVYFGETPSTAASYVKTTKAYKLPEYQVNGETKKGSLIVTYRINVADKGTSTYIGLGRDTSSAVVPNIEPNGNGGIRVGNANNSIAERKTISENHWYNIVWKFNETDTDFYIFDAEGADQGKLVYSRSKKMADAGEIGRLVKGNGAEFWPVYMLGGTASSPKNVGTSVLLDDFAVWSIKPEKAKHALSVTSSSAGNGQFTLSANQPILGTPDMLSMTANDKASYILPEIRYTDFCTMTVDYNQADYFTDYTVDYSGLKAASGAPMAAGQTTELTFRNNTVSEDLAVLGDISCAGLTADSKVTFDMYSETAQNLTMVAAFYNRSYPGQLSAVEVADDFSLNAGLNEDKEITLTKAIDADYIRLYAWDGKDTMQPLMKAHKALTPVKGTLKVLLIGNSLSEDVGRHLNDIAEAGGLTLDLTVKGVGGSSLANHSENLKREIEYGLVEDPSKYQAYIDQVREDKIDRPLYFRIKTGETTVSPGTTGYNKDFLLTTALLEEQYDVISLQQFSTGYSDAGMKEPLEYLTKTIREFQPNADIMIYQAWGGYSGRLDYYKDTIDPLCTKYAAQVPVTNSAFNITAHGDAMEIVPVGRAFYLAETFSTWGGNQYNQGDGNTDAGAQLYTDDYFNTASGLYRDYNHASYYGCYLADAVWFEMLTGQRAPITDAQGNAVMDKPTGYTAADKDTQLVNISDAEHLERLTFLSEIAHQVCKEQRAK